MNIGLYMVFLKEVKCGDLRYGRHNYDYQEGTLVFIAPLEALIDFAHPRGLTPAQVALSWLLDKKPWIVPIPGTTKKAHLDEDLSTAELEFAHGELKDLETAIAKIKIYGDRYTPEEQKRVE